MIAWKLKNRQNLKDNIYTNLHFPVDYYIWIMSTWFLPIVPMAINTIIFWKF